MWIETYTGRQFRYDDIEHNDIDIEDIAHALANMTRFCGHCHSFYSVAEHSVGTMLNIDNPKLRFEALMHDAHEAYMGDIPAPLKLCWPEIKTVEKKIEAAVRKRFKLPEVMTPEVKVADLRMLATEKIFLMSDNTWESLEGVSPYPSNIQMLPPEDAKWLFLNYFDKLWAKQ